MKPHLYEEAHVGNCVCGKFLFHEEHYNGDRVAAAKAYKETMARMETMKTPRVGQRVIVSRNHPSLAGVHGIVVEVQQAVLVCSVQLDHEIFKLPIGLKAHWLEPVPLEVPSFGSVEEADAWLAEHDPTPAPEVPRFASIEEAEQWLDAHRSCKICGDPTDHDGKPHSLKNDHRMAGWRSGTFSQAEVRADVGLQAQVRSEGIVMAPGDIVTFTYSQTSS